MPSNSTAQTRSALSLREAVAPAPEASVLILTGFMGAGKSTVGRLLAQHLQWSFLDLDAEIEREEQQSIASLFAQKGEAYFRSQEEAIFLRLVEDAQASKGPLVLALGGGALESAQTRAWLAERKQLFMVYLAAPLPLLIDRCLAQKSAEERPILLDRERLAARWQRRVPQYETAHLTVNTVELSPEQIVHQIDFHLKRKTR